MKTSTSISEVEPFLTEVKAMACIHCGLCLGSCPTYLENGNENDSPRGRIYLMRALQSGKVGLDPEVVRHLDLCLGCRACEVACPSGVQYGQLLEETRDFVERNYSRSPGQKFLRRVAIEKIFPFPGRMRWAMRGGMLAKKLGGEKWLPKFAREGLALLPERPEDSRLALHSPALSPTPRGRVGFIEGCVMPVLFGNTNRSSVGLLQRLGFEVITPAGQGCCGALYSHGGNLAQARAAARRNIAAFERELENLSAIVINAAGCGSTLKEYGHLLEHDGEWKARGAAFSSKVLDLTEFLLKENWKPERIATAGERVTYHDACHLAHAQRITSAPRRLVQAVAGSNYVELPEADVCCGSAGSYNLTEPEMAERLQRRKVENILKTGARVVVTSNPGCLLQMQAGLKRAGAEIKTVHIADYLWESSK